LGLSNLKQSYCLNIWKHYIIKNIELAVANHFLYNLKIVYSKLYEVGKKQKLLTL
jgi:hypothetical protein